MAVTTADVIKIYPTIADLSGFLTTAQTLVTDQLSDKGLSSTILDQITIYLAAHFATVGLNKGGLRRKKVGDADESYSTPGDKETGLRSTAYGQSAMLLDSSGTLAGLNANASKLLATFEVVEPYRTSADGSG